jgi:membrane dipeptidase
MTLWDSIQREIDEANRRAVEIIKPSEQETERGLRVHREAFVFDFAPPGGPLIYSERLTAKINKLYEEGRLRQTYARSRGPADKISKYYPPEKHLRFDSLPGRLKYEAVKEHAHDPEAKEAYKQAWEVAGVTVMSTGGGGSSLEGYDFHKYKMEILSDVLIPITCAEDVRRAKKEGRHGIIWNTQNPKPFFRGEDLDQDLDRLDLFYRLGLREVQLTYNLNNMVGAGCTERYDFGLTRFGMKVLERLNQLRFLVNVSHCGRQTTLDACEVSKAPVVANHASCEEIYSHPRAKSDEEIHAVAESGGYMGICRVPHFIGWNATIKDLLDHIDYAVNLVGADHVGIGTDQGWAAPIPRGIHEEYSKIKAEYVPASQMPPDAPMPMKDNYAGWWSGFRPEDFPYATDERNFGSLSWINWPFYTIGLVSRGYSDQEITKILGGNFLRVFEKVVG